ncbi:hypothetical protein BDF19DRAFT_430727 [Syncephalis fuscata]|nr:hypothetical protein BDF19DRAFT_430727 [Syncephalis fuscata]
MDHEQINTIDAILADVAQVALTNGTFIDDVYDYVSNYQNSHEERLFYLNTKHSQSYESDTMLGNLRDNNDNEENEDEKSDELPLLLDALALPDLASLNSTPTASTASSPEFSIDSTNTALIDTSSPSIQLPSTWSRHLTTLDNTLDDKEMEKQSKQIIYCEEPTGLYEDTSDKNELLLTKLTYNKPVLPTATTAVLLTPPAKSAVKEKTGQLLKDDEDDYQNTIWHDMPSLSAFWTSDALTTPDDDIDIELAWEKAQAMYATTTTTSTTTTTTTTDSYTDTASDSDSMAANDPAIPMDKKPEEYQIEITPGRGDYFVEVPLRVQLGRQLIRRKLTY